MTPECILWCPACKEDKVEILRKPTGREGCYENDRRVIEPDQNSLRFCTKCGTDEKGRPKSPLERRPDG